MAPIAMAAASSRYGMGACISATCGIYFAAGAILLWTTKSIKGIQPNVIVESASKSV
jgi:hypothetical protein